MRVRWWKIGSSRVFRKDGYSMVELLMVIAILAVALPAIVMLMTIAAREEGHTSTRARAINLAQSLMNEISQRRFYEDSNNRGNGVETGEESGKDRSGFDDIDDYDVFQTWGGLNPPTDEDGNSLTNYSEFTQTVEVYNVSAPTLGPQGRANYQKQSDGGTDFKLVKVKVSWEEGTRAINLYKVFAKE